MKVGSIRLVLLVLDFGGKWKSREQGRGFRGGFVSRFGDCVRLVSGGCGLFLFWDDLENK
jgi:hypothetical protein